MANRIHYPVMTGSGNNFTQVFASFIGNGSSSPDTFNREIESVTRTGAGTFNVVLRHKYPTEVTAWATVRGATAGLRARVSAWDAKAGTLTVVTESLSATVGAGAVVLDDLVVAANELEMASAGYVVGVQATTEDGVVPEWLTGVAVTTNEATLAVPGYVVAVEATTVDGGGDAGVKVIQESGTPAAGFVQVAYDAAGVATLTFAAADEVLEISVKVVRPGALQRSKAMIFDGTPAAGEVLVEYAAGVATLTFATEDNVTEAAVVMVPSGVAGGAAAGDPTTDDVVTLFLGVRNSVAPIGGD